MTRCISETWDKYLSFNEEDPAREAIQEWVREQIESERPTLGEPKILRRAFLPKNWDDLDLDPDELAYEITEIIGKSDALREVAYLVAKNHE